MNALRRKKRWRAAALAVLLLVCSGCALEYGDGLLSLPKLPGEYLMLQEKLNKVTEGGAVLTVADTGPNRQAVQLVDVDGDGDDEAIAFFRLPSGEFKVYVYKRTEDGYDEMGSATGYGKTIRSVYYPHCNYAGGLALALSWGLDDSGSYGMTVFGFTDEGLVSMLDLQYSSMLIGDIDKDGIDELCFAVRDSEPGFALRTYFIKNNEYRLVTDTPLSKEISSVARMRLGYGADEKRAVIVDSLLSNGGGYLTDMVQITGSVAVNETIDQASHSGLATWRPISVMSADIDGDGMMEVPCAPTGIQGMGQSGADNRNKLVWRKFQDGISLPVESTTFHVVSEEWYIMWPEKWGGHVNAMRSTTPNMTLTTFFVQDAQAGSRKDLLSVYMFTGDTRKQYAAANNVTVLRQTSSVIYGYRLHDNDFPELTIAEEDVGALFHTIEKEW